MSRPMHRQVLGVTDHDAPARSARARPSLLRPFLLIPILLCLPLAVGAPVALLAGAATVSPLTLIMTRDDPRELIPALAGTARLVGLYGLLLAAGLAFG